MLLSSQTMPWQTAVDCLMISTPNLLTFHRIGAQLAAAGIAAADSDLGLMVRCDQLDWRMVLESLSLTLSPMQRRDTRVATLQASTDAADLHRAIFRAKSMESLLAEVRHDWFHNVMANDDIVIHFQPLMQYSPGRLYGYECLMRGVDSDGQIIPPSRMFQAAAVLGMTPVLDDRCRKAALREALRLGGTEMTYFVNFVPSALADPWQCLDDMLDEVRRGGLRPNQIVFEVVETDKVYDQRELMCILHAFRKSGFKVALDDVGAGYASLLSLSCLRPDYIKLDGELVRLAAQSAMEAKLVADLAETARQNGIITIAEGIETVRELRLVLDSGIRITQGYFHAKPQPLPLDGPAIGEIVQRIDDVASHCTGRDSTPIRTSAA